MSANICKSCGKENEPDFKFCAFCGEKLPYLVCSKCGEFYNKDYQFCGKCGGKLVDKSVNMDTQAVKKNINANTKTNKIDKSDIEIFNLNYKNKYTARGMETDDGFVLFKGAVIREELVQSAGNNIRNSREENKSKIKNGITTEDILFKTSSAAASFVAGSNLSGPKYWVSQSNKVSIKNSSIKKFNSFRNNDKIFYLQSDNYYAHGTYDGKTFTLFKGAKIRESIAPSSLKKVTPLREKNRSKIKNFVTIEDIQFNSPSSAAYFVVGAAINGRQKWKNKKGQSINDLENQ